jgi:hypothetical protein
VGLVFKHQAHFISPSLRFCHDQTTNPSLQCVTMLLGRE